MAGTMTIRNGCVCQSNIRMERRKSWRVHLHLGVFENRGFSNQHIGYVQRDNEVLNKGLSCTLWDQGRDSKVRVFPMMGDKLIHSSPSYPESQRDLWVTDSPCFGCWDVFSDQTLFYNFDICLNMPKWIVFSRTWPVLCFPPQNPPRPPQKPIPPGIPRPPSRGLLPPPWVLPSRVLPPWVLPPRVLPPRSPPQKPPTPALPLASAAPPPQPCPPPPPLPCLRQRHSGRIQNFLGREDCTNMGSRCDETGIEPKMSWIYAWQNWNSTDQCEIWMMSNDVKRSCAKTNIQTTCCEGPGGWLLFPWW